MAVQICYGRLCWYVGEAVLLSLGDDGYRGIIASGVDLTKAVLALKSCWMSA